MLAVSDTGHGMDDATRARAFEPFFATKQHGRGSGLGLSQVYGFVKQSGGHINLYSEPGLGTTIKVYLPRFVGDEAELVPPRWRASTPAGHELILVVDDHELVRTIAKEYLALLGYRVIDASGAMVALEMIDQHPDVSLLLTDVVLPEMNGCLLAEEARRRLPDIKVVFTSGYTQNAIVHHGRIDRDVHFIGKPFKLDNLGRKMREVLDQQ
jgi:CheY-like chemotaxis protein